MLRYAFCSTDPKLRSMQSWTSWRLGPERSGLRGQTWPIHKSMRGWSQHHTVTTAFIPMNQGLPSLIWGLANCLCGPIVVGIVTRLLSKIAYIYCYYVSEWYHMYRSDGRSCQAASCIFERSAFCESQDFWIGKLKQCGHFVEKLRKY